MFFEQRATERDRMEFFQRQKGRREERKRRRRREFLLDKIEMAQEAGFGLEAPSAKSLRGLFEALEPLKKLKWV